MVSHMLPRNIRLLGKVWQLIWYRFPLSPCGECNGWGCEECSDKGVAREHGDCDAPYVKDKQIRVERSLKGRERLETLLHEMEHACDWRCSEEYVERAAHDKAKVLWDLGYRLPDDPKQ